MLVRRFRVHDLYRFKNPVARWNSHFHQNDNVDLIVQAMKKNESSLNEILKENNIATTKEFNKYIRIFFDLKDSSTALNLFKEMKSNKIDRDSKTYGIIINGLVKTDQLPKALYLFEKFKHKIKGEDVVLYSTIINGVLKQGDEELAIKYLKEMRTRGSAKNINIYNTALQYLVQQKSYDRLLRVYNELQSLNTIKADKFTYSFMIMAYCDQNEIEKAIELLDEMENSIEKQDLASYPHMNILVNLIQETDQNKTYKYTIKQLLQKIYTFPKEMNTEALNSILSFLKKTKNDEMCSVELFRFLSSYANVTTYSIMIDLFCKVGKISEAFSYLERMKNENIHPNSTTLTTILNYVTENNLDNSYIDRIKADMKNYGLEVNISNFNVKLKKLCDSNILDAVELLKDPRYEKNEISFNTVISRLCKIKKLGVAVELLELMESDRYNLTADTITYNMLIQGFYSTKNYNFAVDIFERAKKKEISLDVISYSTIISCLCQFNPLKALSVFLEMKEKKIQPNIITYNALINNFCKIKFSQAVEIFEMMKVDHVKPDILTYNYLISGYCHNNDYRKAYELIALMRKQKISPDTYSVFPFILSLCKKRRISDAISCYDSFKEINWKPDGKIISILIKSASKYKTSVIPNLVAEAESNNITLEPEILKIVNSLSDEKK